MARLLVIALVLLAFAVPAFAGDTAVRGYLRRDGTYVQPYHRTTPDNTINNNYGTSPNINPWSGQRGTRAPEPSFQFQPMQPFGSQPSSTNPWSR